MDLTPGPPNPHLRSLEFNNGTSDVQRMSERTYDIQRTIICMSDVRRTIFLRNFARSTPYTTHRLKGLCVAVLMHFWAESLVA